MYGVIIVLKGFSIYREGVQNLGQTIYLQNNKP